MNDSRARVHISNLRLQAIIGFREEERNKEQDIIINIRYEYNAAEVIDSDDPDQCVDYTKLKKRVISAVGRSSFFTLEALTGHILETVLEESAILSASVTIEKPHALRFADSVSVTLSSERNNEPGSDWRWL